jgi:hypothetical protein
VRVHLTPRKIVAAAALLTVALTFPGLVRIHRLRTEIRAMQQGARPDDLVIYSGTGQAPPDTLREAEILRDVIRELAGDHPGRLGDLKLGAPQATTFGRQVDFSVNGRASFDQMAAKLAWLEGLWPLAHVSGFNVSRGETGAGLDVELSGRFEFRRRLDGVAGTQAAATSPPPARNPFQFGSAPAVAAATPAATPAASPASPTTGPAPPFPGFQGTMVLGDDKVAFFGGKSYRPGDCVAGRRLLDVIDGRPILASKGDSL